MAILIAMNFDPVVVKDAIAAEWGWMIPGIADVIAVNAMGNVFLSDESGAYWRIFPEGLTAEIVAKDQAEAEALYADEDFKADWEMAGLVELLAGSLGGLEDGQCYTMIVPAVLGGEYSEANFRIGSLEEYLWFTGDVANEVKDLKEGETFEITWT